MGKYGQKEGLRQDYLIDTFVGFGDIHVVVRERLLYSA